MYQCRDLNCLNSGLEGWLSTKKENCPVCGKEMTSYQERFIKFQLKIEESQFLFYIKKIEKKLGREVNDEEIEMYKKLLFK